MINKNKEEIQIMLMDYLYGELSPKDQKDLEDRLESNMELKDEFNQLKATLRQVQEMEQKNSTLKVPPKITENIMVSARKAANQMRDKKERVFSERLGTFLKPSYAFAASLLMIAGITFWVNQWNQQKNPNIFDRNERTLRFAEPLQNPGTQLTASNKYKSFSQNPLSAPPSKELFVLNNHPNEIKKLQSQPLAPKNKVIDLPLQMVSNNLSPQSSSPKDFSFGNSKPPLSVQQEMQVAQIFESNQDWTQALAHYRNVTLLAPNSLETVLAYHRSARLQELAQNHQKALQLYETIVQNWDDYSHLDKVLWESAEIYINEKQWEQAHKNLKMLHQQFPHYRKQILPKIEYVNQHLTP